MRTHRRALALNGVHGARNGGREPDAVLRVPHVVIHGLRHGHHFHALAVELGRVAQGVVPADGNQVIEPQRVDVLQHGLRQVVDRGCDAFLGGFLGREILALERRGHLLHLRGIGARAVQVRPAGAVDAPRVLAVQRQDVAGAARRILQVDMGQAFPAAANANHLAADLASTVYHRLDHGVQSRHVAAARENANALYSHECSLSTGSCANGKTHYIVMRGGKERGDSVCGAGWPKGNLRTDCQSARAAIGDRRAGWHPAPHHEDYCTELGIMPATYIGAHSPCSVLRSTRKGHRRARP